MKRRLSQIFEDIDNDSGEVSSEVMGELVNGSCSRRGSLNQEILINLEDLSSLQRAISCESVCSDTSVVLNDLESEAEERPVVGLVCMGLEHDRWPSHNGETDLIVSVLEARDLIAPDGRPAQNTFIRVCLLPDRQTYVQTRLYRGTDSPSYQEKFYFPLDGSSFDRTLLIEVIWDNIETFHMIPKTFFLFFNRYILRLRYSLTSFQTTIASKVKQIFWAKLRYVGVRHRDHRQRRGCHSLALIFHCHNLAIYSFHLVICLPQND